MMKLGLLLCVSLVLCVVMPNTASAVQYRATDMGIVAWQCIPSDINDAGQIVGFSYDSVYNQAFLWNESLQRQYIPGSIATSLNNFGLASGYVLDSNGRYSAYTFDLASGTSTCLVSEDSVYSTANGLNDHGQIVGTYQGQSGIENACIWSGTERTEIPIDHTSFGTGINEPGHVIGNHIPVALYGTGFFWDGTTFTDLGALGGTSSKASAINNLDQVVGWAALEDQSSNAYIWQNGKMTSLGTLGGSSSEAVDINDLGQVIGFSQTADPTQYHAFIWENSVMTDLSALVPTEYTFDLTAVAINNSGQIVGTYRQDGFVRGVMFTPVPEPGSLAAIFSGILGFALYRRRK